MCDKLTADYSAHNLPEGCHSTRGVGKTAPKGGEMLGEVFIPNGVLVPTGT